MTGWVAAGFIAGASWAVRGRSSQVFGRSVWQGDPTRRAVALTFDDGPSESTPKLLDLLAKHGARATFFQCGSNAARLPEIARAVSEAGHEIGNHTQSHARLWLRSPDFVRREIDAAQETLTHIHGEPPRLFRAPYGVRWFGVSQAQRRNGLTGVMWTAIGPDWKHPGGKVAARLKARVRNGAILCLHDGRELARDPDISSTLDATGELLASLGGEGYSFQTVGELAVGVV